MSDRISRWVDISLRTLLTLASAPDGRTTIADLARDLRVPVRYQGKVIQRLSAAGWVTTTRGKNGGLTVSEAGRTVTPEEVMDELEGGRPPVDCTDPPCPLLLLGCPLRGLITDAEIAFRQVLGAKTIAELV